MGNNECRRAGEPEPRCACGSFLKGIDLYTYVHTLTTYYTATKIAGKPRECVAGCGT